MYEPPLPDNAVVVRGSAMQRLDTRRALVKSLFQVRGELRNATSEQKVLDPYLGRLRLTVYAHASFGKQELLDAVSRFHMQQDIVRFSTAGRLRQEGWEVARKLSDLRPHHHNVYFPLESDLDLLLVRIDMCFDSPADRWVAS